jgi:hypothetical protein
VQPLADEIEIHRPLPGLQARDGLGGGRFRVVEAEARIELDDDRPAAPPGLAELVGYLAADRGDPDSRA